MKKGEEGGYHSRQDNANGYPNPYGSDYFMSTPVFNDKLVTFSGQSAASSKLNPGLGNGMQRQFKTEASPKMSSKLNNIQTKFGRSETQEGREPRVGLSNKIATATENLRTLSREREHRPNENRLGPAFTQILKPQSDILLGKNYTFSEQKVRHLSSMNGAHDEMPQSAGNSNFLNNLSKLKDMNSRHGNREPTRVDGKALSTFADTETNGFFIRKQQLSGSNGFTQEAKPTRNQLNLERPASASRVQGLDTKRKELKGKLNELLDKLATNNSTKGETKSMMQQNIRDNEDNMSINSFQSIHNNAIHNG